MSSSPTSTGQPAQRWPVIWMLTANLISNLGNTITMLAVPWFVLETTGSASKMGLVSAATLAPMVISSFVGGAITDRMSHRQLAVLSDVLSGLTVATVPALYYTTGLNITALMALMFLGAIFDGPGMNARMAMIPKLAAQSGMSLERVNSGFSVGRSLVALIGAPIGGLLIALIGAPAALLIDAATFAVSAAIVRLMLPATSRPEPTGTTMRADMMEGLRFLFGSRLLQSIALTATVLNMVLSPIITIGMPIYVTNMDSGAGTLGFLMTSLAIGGLAGSACYGWLGDRLPARAATITSVFLITLPLFGVAMQPPLVTMWALLLVLHFGAGIVNPLVGTFFQRYTPERLLGRTVGTLNSTAMLASPVGMLVGGALIASKGFGLTALMGTIAMLAVALPLAFNTSLAELDGPAATQSQASQPVAMSD